ncbi:trypsin-like serine protease [Kribbia dieselivorans]|uniref:trypsin-like serine protease n=1 Tax=Kribbia dieselivorans TaxID=331526 RepID=UPI0012EE93B4|nr:trypsin-like serine protease [Kribbia dieselivorans]
MSRRVFIRVLLGSAASAVLVLAAGGSSLAQSDGVEGALNGSSQVSTSPDADADVSNSPEVLEASQTPAARAIEEAISSGIAVEQVSDVARVTTKLADGTLEGRYDGFPIAELQDMTSVARSGKKSAGQVVAKARVDKEFMPIYRKAAKLDGFAGGAIRGTMAESWIGFKGSVPEEIATTARAAGITVRPGRGWSLQEMQDYSSKVHDAARRVTPGAVTTFVDEEAMAIDIAVPEDSRTAAERAVAETVGYGLAASSEGPRVTWNAVPERQARPQDSAARGGGHLNACTVGFVLAAQTSGAKRLGTAGHCTVSRNSDTYRNHPVDGGSTAVNQMWSHQGSYGDIGYTSHGAFNGIATFYAAKDVKRSIRWVADEVADMPVGKTLCVYGRTSGSLPLHPVCTEVRARRADVDGMGEMVVMTEAITEQGDSGGPWYWSESAYGIHYGVDVRNGDAVSAFTPVMNYSQFGFRVLTR